MPPISGTVIFSVTLYLNRFSSYIGEGGLHMCVKVHACGFQWAMPSFIPVPQALSTLVFETGSLFDLDLAK